MGYLSRRRTDLVLAAGFTVALFAASWYRHATFRSTIYDLGVVEQVLWKMAHGHGATSSLTAWNTFADHLSPIMVVFVPLYRLAATPLWLFAAQALALGIGVLAVRPLAAAVGLDPDRWPTRALLVAFVLSPALWNAAIFDFHSTTLAVPVLMIGITAALRNDHRTMWLCFAALVLLRDDLAIAGAAVAVMGWRRDPTGRRSRALLIGAAVVWTGIGTKLAEVMGSTRHWGIRYGYLGDSALDAAAHLPRTVVALGHHLLVADNALPVLALLVPLALLPLGRPGWVFLAAMLALPVLVANDVNFRSPAYHYGAPLLPFLLAAAASTLGSPRFSPEKTVAAACACMAVASFALIGPPATQFLGMPRVAGPDARRAIASIGPTESVVATTYLGAHLAHRKTLLPFPAAILDTTWDYPLDTRVTDASEAARRRVDVVITATPTGSVEERAFYAAAAQLRLEGFRPEHFGDVTVYRRGAEDAVSSTRP